MLLICRLAFGFHIVGGEIEFITINPGVYKINLIQYRDAAQQENIVYETSIELYMFSNLDNRLVRRFVLPLGPIDEVPYTNQECSRDELKTERVIYSDTIQLNPEEFADPQGYYLVWERCCRNKDIVNIVDPLTAGMTYTIDIPPLWKNGEPFINSSPILLKPLSDYACVGQLYYGNFTGTDPDGDSLTYKLVTPLTTSAAIALPLPQSRPHGEVLWSDGFSLSNVIPGNPALKISGAGTLQVNPVDTGLYVFSVLIEEWREAEKIGQVQRDFQMLVVDGCEPPVPPKVAVKIPDNEFFNPELDTLRYTLEEEKCFDFYVTEIDAGEDITLTARLLNYDKNLDEGFEFQNTTVSENQDTIKVQFCAPGCPPSRDPFILVLIASDNACPLPQVDSVELVLQVEPPPNEFPVLTGIGSSYVLREDQRISVFFQVTDMDGDSIELILKVPGIENAADLGLSVTTTKSQGGLLEGTLNWDTNCRDYDFSEIQNFELLINPEDRDVCEFPNDQLLSVNMSVVLPVNSEPEISIDSDPEISLEDKEHFETTVFAKDFDQDSISVKLEGRGFNPRSLGVDFKDTIVVGSVTLPFELVVDCYILENISQRTFDFLFIVEDIDRCQDINSKSTMLTVNIELEENNSPSIEEYADTILYVNKTFEIDISALDPNPEDDVTLEWFNPARLPKSDSLIFETNTGKGSVTSRLRWTPECSLLDFGVPYTYYDLIFLAYDNGCPVQKLDTMKITVALSDQRDPFVKFRPPNVFTPNGDGINDVFTLTNQSQPGHNLPRNLCNDAFEWIRIFDRNGTQVYESLEREFVWDGANNPTGVYYYAIKYQQSNYKGYLQILK